MESIKLERKAGRPKGGKLSDSDKLKAKERIKEYQKDYRKSHQSNPRQINAFVKRIKTITIEKK
jgi:hypothetical protein